MVVVKTTVTTVETVETVTTLLDQLSFKQGNQNETPKKCNAILRNGTRQCLITTNYPQHAHNIYMSGQCNYHQNWVKRGGKLQDAITYPYAIPDNGALTVPLYTHDELQDCIYIILLKLYYHNTAQKEGSFCARFKRIVIMFIFIVLKKKGHFVLKVHVLLQHPSDYSGLILFQLLDDNAKSNDAISSP